MAIEEDVKSASASPTADNKPFDDIHVTNPETSLPEATVFRAKKSWKHYLWDTLDKSPEERRFLFKLDAVLLTFASLGYFIKYLDQININNAFVAGMKEDLSLHGNQLNYMQTCWTVGYVIGQVPRYVLQLLQVWLLD